MKKIVASIALFAFVALLSNATFASPIVEKANATFTKSINPTDPPVKEAEANKQETTPEKKACCNKTEAEKKGCCGGTGAQTKGCSGHSGATTDHKCSTQGTGCAGHSGAQSTEHKCGGAGKEKGCAGSTGAQTKSCCPKPAATQQK
ncbi:MAG: hypothetical protein WCK02_01820 [Bacteroidota bacterium]